MNTEELKLPIGDTYMNVIRFGSGKKHLVMLAGISLLGLEGMGEAVAEAYKCFWDEYTVYLFDRRKVLPADFDTADMARDVLYCLDQLHVTKADFFGASHGGMMALDIALMRPQMVSSLFLASSCARSGSTCRMVMERWISLAEREDIYGLNTDFICSVFTQELAGDYISGMGDMLRAGTKADCERFIVLCRAVKRFDMLDKLSMVCAPAVVVGASEDRVLTPEASRELAEGLNAPLYLYPGYGHAVYDEAPDYKQRMLNFFRSY